MFEKRKTITVNGVSFNMILVEGDKFSIGDEEHEVDDFYMAEFPVTQELFMAVMGPAHTGSYDMMPENFDYLNPKNSIYYNALVDSIKYRNETKEERRKRLDREWFEKCERESKERDRIRKLAATLPVNNVSWLEAVNFISKLNQMTGLSFALPSFDQWYFAASGGVESKEYAFSGSDDANAVGHFNTLSTLPKSEGLFVMSDGSNKQLIRKAAVSRYTSPDHYQPNELGIYDMSGLVFEWLDKAGEVIGGSYFSNPDHVTKAYKYGYAKFNLANGSPDVAHYMTPRPKEKPEYLLGFRLIMAKHPKKYVLPTEPSVISKVSDIEWDFINTIIKIKSLGLLRSVIAEKYVKPSMITPHFERWGFSSFQGNIYNVFVCPQNLTSFNGDCFSNFLSRRKFVNHCKEEFIKLLTLLSEEGYNLLIIDNLGLNLTDLGLFSTLKVDVNGREFKMKREKIWLPYLEKYTFVTNNPDVFEIGKITPISDKRPKLWDYIKLSANTILVEVKDTFQINNNHEISDEWLYSVELKPCRKDDLIRISLNCFCDFNSNGNGVADYVLPQKIVTRIKDRISIGYGRVNNKAFDNTENINRLFCSKNKGGLYEYHYPPSSGRYLIQDEEFFVMPFEVHEEMFQSLKRK